MLQLVLLIPVKPDYNIVAVAFPHLDFIEGEGVGGIQMSEDKNGDCPPFLIKTHLRGKILPD